MRRLLADNVTKKGSEALKTRRYKNEKKGERKRGEAWSIQVLQSLD